MDSPSMPYPGRETVDKQEQKESLEALLNLLELIGEDIYSPSRVRAYVKQARKLIQSMHDEL